MTRLTGKLRKAAILIASLDQRSADALLEQMPPEQAARIRSALMELDDTIDEQEQRTVLHEFLQNRAAPAGRLPGVELDPALQSKLSSRAAWPTSPATDEATSASQPSPAPASPANFQFLEQAAPRDLASVLQQEHPQIAAVVLAHVAPAFAARVVSCLGEEFRAEVLGRVAELEGADVEVLRDLEAQLQARLRYSIPPPQRTKPGLGAARAILAELQEAMRSALVERLAQQHQDLIKPFEPAAAATSGLPTAAGSEPANAAADSNDSATVAWPPRPPHPSAAGNAPGRITPREDAREHAMDVDSAASRRSARDTEVSPATGDENDADDRFTPLQFADVLNFSDPDLARLLRAVDPQLTLVALAGAPPAFVDRILAQVPARDARRLRGRFHQLGPLRLRDVEQAQQQLALAATQLVERGTLNLPVTRRFVAAA